MRQIDGVIFEAIYYDVVRTSFASIYEADAVIDCKSGNVTISAANGRTGP